MMTASEDDPGRVVDETLGPALQIAQTLLDHGLVDDLHLMTVGDGVAILLFRRPNPGSPS
jgi:hypothetical protein